MNSSENNIPQSWVSYRPETKVLDCTIRDGGLMNDSQFEDDVVKAVYHACVAAGVDYMEIGYKNDKNIFSPEKYGAWRFSTEEDVRRIVGDNDSDLKISVMADAGKCDYKNDIVKKSDSPIDMIRVACYLHQMSLAVDMVNDAHDKGYETCLNIMAASTLQDNELEAGLELAVKTGTKAIYLVDSFGHFYGEQTKHFINKYLKYAKANGVEVGIHAHNNLQLGFSNTIDSVIQGANFLDATMAGLGRGAGNCPLELLLGFLHNPKYKVRPVIDCIQNYIEPMRKDLGWGFDLNYMITGFFNRHPRSAIEFNQSKDKLNHTKFFDQLLLDL